MISWRGRLRLDGLAGDGISYTYSAVSSGFSSSFLSGFSMSSLVSFIVTRFYFDFSAITDKLLFAIIFAYFIINYIKLN